MPAASNRRVRLMYPPARELVGVLAAKQRKDGG